jgi:hypothetical protein
VLKTRYIKADPLTEGVDRPPALSRPGAAAVAQLAMRLEVSVPLFWSFNGKRLFFPEELFRTEGEDGRTAARPPVPAAALPASPTLPVLPAPPARLAMGGEVIFMRPCIFHSVILHTEKTEWA